jgi:hypothetical protein
MWKFADGARLKDLATHLSKKLYRKVASYTPEKRGRVKRAMLLFVMSYLLLLRSYGKELDPDQGFTIFQLKRWFCDQTWQEQLDRS